MDTALFQRFQQVSSPELGKKRLAALRLEMAKEGLDGFVVPHADRYQSENLAPGDERLAWLTGFTGSAGFCVCLLDKAGLFVDSRYTIQAQHQTNKAFTPIDWPAVTFEDWVIANSKCGQKIGFDPWLHTAGMIEYSNNLLLKSGIELLPCENLIDRVWSNQPEPPKESAYLYSIEYAGKPTGEKISEISNILTDEKQFSMVVSLPENIAWLLNIRGRDVAHVPLVHCSGILYKDGHFDLFVDPLKIEKIKGELPRNIRVYPQDKFEHVLTKLSSPVRIDPSSIPHAINLILQSVGINTVKSKDPIALAKALKNTVEIKQARVAHARDAAAMCEFLAWLDEQPIGKLSEIDIVIALEKFRLANPELIDISFDTISASGPNAALPHYRVTYETNRMLAMGETLLIDSGGQYLDGTTDITRTIAIGQQNKDVCEAFTRVLKGMIAISLLKFPKGTTGQEIDSHARAPLWEAGQDFGHGTGHGVGHFLSVHEGPQRISRTPSAAFEKGMILSNEPAFYKPGVFGIRTENLLLVKESEVDTEKFLEFETLTFVPIDKRMIIKELLSKIEIEWLNNYHKLCFKKNASLLGSRANLWLSHVTKPI